MRQYTLLFLLLLVFLWFNSQWVCLRASCRNAYLPSHTFSNSNINVGNFLVTWIFHFLVPSKCLTVVSPYNKLTPRLRMHRMWLFSIKCTAMHERFPWIRRRAHWQTLYILMLMKRCSQHSDISPNKCKIDECEIRIKCQHIFMKDYKIDTIFWGIVKCKFKKIYEKCVLCQYLCN